MKLKDIISPIIAAILPVGVYELVTNKLGITGFSFTVILLAGVASFILLIAISAFWNLLSMNRINTEDFVGKTYTLTGEEKYSWSIDYLRPDKDISFNYNAYRTTKELMGKIDFNKPT